jgi:hypothetical protein
MGDHAKPTRVMQNLHLQDYLTRLSRSDHFYYSRADIIEWQ